MQTPLSRHRNLPNVYISSYRKFHRIINREPPLRKSLLTTWCYRNDPVELNNDINRKHWAQTTRYFCFSQQTPCQIRQIRRLETIHVWPPTNQRSRPCVSSQRKLRNCQSRLQKGRQGQVEYSEKTAKNSTMLDLHMESWDVPDATLL